MPALGNLIDNFIVKIDVDSADAEGKVTKTSEKVDVLAHKFSALNVVLGGMKIAAIGAAAGNAIQGINALGAGVVGLTSALAPLAGWLAVVPSGILAMGQAAGAAKIGTMGVTEALKAQSAVHQASFQSTNQLIDIQHQHVQASHAVRNAIEQEKQAELNLAAARAQSGAIEAAQAELDLEQANLERATAIAELNKLQNQYNATLQTTIRAVADAKDDFTGKTVELVQTQVGKDSGQAQREREAAELRVKEATLSVQRAEEAITQQKILGTQADRNTIAAQRALRDAQEAVLEAQFQMNSLNRESLGAKAMDAYRLALQKLSPSAKLFVEDLRKVRPELHLIQQSIQEAMFSGAVKGFDAARGSLNLYGRQLVDTGGVLGGFAAKLGTLVGSQGFAQRLADAMHTNNEALKAAGDGAIHAANGLSYIADAAKPLVEFIGQVADKWGKAFEQWAKTGSESGKLNDYFQKTIGVTKQLFDILHNTYELLKNIGRQAAPLGQWMLDAFQKATAAAKDWSDQTKNAGSIFTFFNSQKSTLHELALLVGDIGKAFVSIDGGTLAPLIETLRTQLLPIVVKFIDTTSKGFSQPLIDALTAVAQAFTDIYTSGSGALQLLLPIITKLAESVDWLVRNVPGLGQIAAIFLTWSSLKKFTAVENLMGLFKGQDVAGFASILRDKAIPAMDKAKFAASEFGSALSGMAAGAAVGVGLVVLTQAIENYTGAAAKGKQQGKDFANSVDWSSVQSAMSGINQAGNEWNAWIDNYNHHNIVWRANHSDEKKAWDEKGKAIQYAQDQLSGYMEQGDTVARLTHTSISDAQQWVLAQKKLGTEYSNDTDLLKAYNSHLKQLADDGMAAATKATNDQLDAQLGLATAQLDYQDSLDNYNKVMKDSSATDRDKQRALLELESAAMRASDAAKTKAQNDYAAYGQKAPHDGIDAQIAALEEQKKKLDPTSPLAVYLDQYINKLKNDIPKDVQTNMKLDTSMAVDQIVALYKLLHQDIPDVPMILKQGKNGPIGFAARGAQAKAGQAWWVGEQGPELFIPQGAGEIVPAARSAALASTQSNVDSGPIVAAIRELQEKVEAMRPVSLAVTNEHPVDPMHIASDLAWRL